MSATGLPIGHELSVQETHDYFVYQLIAMVIEDCKAKWGLDGDAVFQKLQAGGVIDYLTDGYDYLHTQSMEYITDDVEDMIEAFEKAGGVNA
jgi:hypothetical protein